MHERANYESDGRKEERFDKWPKDTLVKKSSLGMAWVSPCPGCRFPSRLHHLQLDLTEKAFVVFRFSAEGTPFYLDSAGILYMLNRNFGNTWIQVSNTKKHVSN